MRVFGYAFRVKTIEAIRLENYKRLVTEIKGEQEKIRPPDIARALGISKVYAWQLENGKREAIDSKAARLMERGMGKPDGWLDTNFDMWPFPDVNLLGRVQALDKDQLLELQGAMRKMLSDFEQFVSAGGTSSRVSYSSVASANRREQSKPHSTTPALDREDARHRDGGKHERDEDQSSQEPGNDTGRPKDS
jgi:transcriptional regulator with XRE-family HTH domain